MTVVTAPFTLAMLLPAAAVCQEGREIRHEDDLPVATLVEVLELDLSEAPIAGRVSSLVESPDGTVFVGGSTEVLVFDPDGAYRGEIGRQGDGPGEFRSLTGLGMHGDTLWTGDAMSGRVTRFLSDGSLLEIITPASIGSRRAEFPDPRGRRIHRWKPAVIGESRGTGRITSRGLVAVARGGRVGRGGGGYAHRHRSP